MGTCIVEVFVTAEQIKSAGFGVPTVLAAIPAGATIIGPEDIQARIREILCGKKVPIVLYSYEDGRPTEMTVAAAPKVKP